VLSLVPVAAGGLSVLCLGAHPDDIEIGAGGTVLQLAAAGRLASAAWVVLSGTPERAREGRRSAAAFLDGVADPTIAFHEFRDGYFPAAFGEIKDAFEGLKASVRPDLVLVPRTDDAHQDHRLVAQLAWNTFRDHLILEYEIPKYDGDLGAPDVFVPLDEAILERKIDLIAGAFGSQAGRTWFDPETFRGLARIRGIEAGGDVRYAEAFHARKLRLAIGAPVGSGPAPGANATAASRR
jgi:LmbE family N-acetylglucosaminyl deacetylase